MWSKRISYCDGATCFHVSYEDLAAFHGGRYPAGVALGYKALQLVQNVLFSDGGMLKRRTCRIETAFMGLGFRDVLEMVLRGTTAKTLERNPAMLVPQGVPQAPVQGYFFFRVLQDNGVLEFSLKPDLIPLEFYEKTEALHRSYTKKAEENLLALRKTITDNLLRANPSDVFDIHHLKIVQDNVEKCVAPTEFDQVFLFPFQDYGTFNATLPLLQAYHGEDSLCGVCLAASLMKRFVAERTDNTPISRRDCSLRAGAWGKGIGDAMTCLLRFDDEPQRLTLDPTWGESYSLPIIPGGGSFVFQLCVADETPKVFALQEDRTPGRYFELCRQKYDMGTAFTQEKERKERQLDFARSVLQSDPWIRMS